MYQIVKYILAASLLFSTFSATAAGDCQASQTEKRKWDRAMVAQRQNYMTRALGLTEEQKTAFFEVYDAMDRELRGIGEQARKMEKEVEAKGDKATDLELEKAAEAQIELPGKESQIRIKYFPRLKQTLTPRQLFKLRKVERDFRHTMMQQHQKRKK